MEHRENPIRAVTHAFGPLMNTLVTSLAKYENSLTEVHVRHAHAAVNAIKLGLRKEDTNNRMIFVK